MSLNKKIYNRIRKLSSAYSLSKGHIYKNDFKQIVIGFVIESTQSAIYISTFAIPLYQPTEFFHLSYGLRKIYNEKPHVVDIEDLASTALAFLAEIECLKNLPDFLMYLDSIHIDTPDVNEARFLTFARIVSESNGPNEENFLDGMELTPKALMIENLLRENPPLANRQLDEWRSNSILNLGLEHRAAKQADSVPPLTSRSYPC